MEKTIDFTEKQKSLKDKRGLSTIEGTIGANLQEIIKNGCNAIVYTYELRGTPFAVAFKGKSIKPKWHYRFKETEHREKTINKFFEGILSDLQVKRNHNSNRRKYKEEYASKIQLGTIVTAGWGYEQTNRDFYQVTKILGRFKVELTEIAHSKVPGTEEHDSCMVVPVKDKFIGQPFTKLITINGMTTPHSSLRICKENESYYMSWGY